MEGQPLERTVEEFMTVTAKSRVAVIVPLFGYWNDIKDNPLTGEVLEVVMKRLYSNVHHLLLIFVANPQTIPDDVANILVGRSRAGNVKNIPVTRGAPYAQYVREGLRYAIDETESQFMVVFNPWVMIQEGAIDVLVDRANRAGDAKVISGFDLRSVLNPEDFDNYKNDLPKEQYECNLNFLGMPRYAAEMMNVDPEYQTHEYLERDMWQSMFKQGFVTISSERVPIFPFDFPWKSYESETQFEADKVHFTSKWGFDAGLGQRNS